MNRIIYLLKKDQKEIDMLSMSLKLLKVNFLPSNDYPIFVLHDEMIEEEIFDKLQSDVKFTTVFVDFKSDEYQKNIKPGVDDKIRVPGVDRYFDMGYRHMCRFYSYGMYEVLELQDTDLYLRLDCDSYFTEPVDYDIFKYMEDNDLIYGYNLITTDNPLVSKNLWEVSKDYSRTVDVIKTPIDGIPQYNMYYTNFEIAKFHWFKESAYKPYFDFIDNENGIYKWRWGDAIIKYLGIEMFLPENKKHLFNVPYKHGNIFNL
jgi:alpha 1,2-mannosyltransferase